MDAVEEIKSRLAIEDVASEYMQLKRSGRNYKALSPFSNERTPSFMISPEKQIWHDFSSGKGGDVFGLVMELEGLDFKGALELLARRANIDLAQYSKSSAGNSDHKKRLQDLLDLSTKFYQAQLKANPKAITYIIKKRRFTPDTISAWRLGYSPSTGKALAEFALKKGFTQAELKEAGLGTMRSGGFSDMFRGRIMVPLADAQGNIIGFTARLLEDDPNAPKYINTPATLLYDKSRHVFGLHLAKEAIRKSGFVVIAEGNLDVISSWQAGVRQVVATAGTAMTSQQIKTLGRFTNDIRLAYDQDRAGQTAAERAISVAQGEKVELKMITVPLGKDPDELIKQDKVLWEKAVNEPQYALDWLIDRYVQAHDISSASGKKALTNAVMSVLSKLQDSVEQEHYMKKLAEISDVPVDAIRSKLQGGSKSEGSRKRAIKAAIEPVMTDSTGPIQDCLLALALTHPSLRESLRSLPEELFSRDNRNRMYAFLCANPDVKNSKELATALKTDEDYVKILGLQYDELYADVPVEDQIEEFGKLRTRITEQYVRMKKQTLLTQLVELEQSGQKLDDVLKQIKELDALLVLTKGDD